MKGSSDMSFETFFQVFFLKIHPKPKQKNINWKKILIELLPQISHYLKQQQCPPSFLMNSQFPWDDKIGIWNPENLVSNSSLKTYLLTPGINSLYLLMLSLPVESKEKKY